MSIIGEGNSSYLNYWYLGNFDSSLESHRLMWSITVTTITKINTANKEIHMNKKGFPYI